MSEIPEDLKERARWEIEMFERPHVDTSIKLLERVEELEAHVEALQEKQVAETCGCSHDQLTDVCLGHSPMLKKSKDECDALKAHILSLTQVLESKPILDACPEIQEWLDRKPQISMTRVRLLAKAEVLSATADRLENTFGEGNPDAYIDVKFLRRDAQQLVDEAKETPNH